MKKKRAFVSAALCVALCGCGIRGNSEALGTLVSQAREEAAKEKDLKKETEAYLAVRRALDKGFLKKGDSASEASRKFGRPSVVIPEKKGQTWLYKANDWNWFAAPKVYLYFDESGRLDRWRSGGAKPE